MSRAEERRFSVELPDGAVLRASVGGSGRALLLVSGLGGTAAFWDVAAATLARSFRVIRFDQRGIADSTRGTAPCTIDQLAEDCLRVLDTAGEREAVVLGHSTGGCIAQAMARMAPKRVPGLILSGAWLRPSRYMDAQFRIRRTVLDRDPVAYAALAALFSYPPSWIEMNWSVYEAAAARVPASDADRQVVRERIDALLSFDGSEHAAALAMPILVLGARDDMIVPAFLQEELAAACPGSAKALLETGGHLFPVSRPDAFTAAVADWIGRL